MEKLIIDDAMVQQRVRMYKTYGELLQADIDEYLRTLNIIRCEGIISGATASQIDCFIGYAEKLYEVIHEMGSQLSQKCDDFITEVDEKDQYLY